MSEQNMSIVDTGLNIGTGVPSDTIQGDSSAVFVSLSELIAEHVFYHPALVSGTENLSELELQSLASILNEKSIKEHFIATLVTAIQEEIADKNALVKISLSDSDSHHFKTLIGGHSVESDEVNPAIGLRGVSRFASQAYAEGFKLECEVIKTLQKLHYNIEIVVPFVRSLSDAATIIDRLAEQGLPRGLNGLKVSYVCQVPSAALLADRLLQYFDGVVIDWDGLTQCTLGIDKYNEALAYLYNPESQSITMLVDYVTSAAEKVHKPLSIVTTGLADYTKLQTYLLDNHSTTRIFNF